MKNIVTSFRRRGMVFFCAIALAAVGGLMFVACDDGSTDPGKNTNQPPGGGTTYPIASAADLADAVTKIKDARSGTEESHKKYTLNFTADVTSTLTIGTSLEYITVTLTGTDKKLILPTVTDGSAPSLLSVSQGQKFIIDGLTLDGATSTGYVNDLVYVAGTLELKNGAIINFNGSSAAVSIRSGGDFTMSGGTISGISTTASSPGAVYVSSGSTFTMTGGEIKDNKNAESAPQTNGYGGGVYVAASYQGTSGGDFTMSGGTISGNSSYQYGGVFVGQGATFTKQAADSNATPPVTGGVIYGNDEEDTALKNTYSPAATGYFAAAVLYKAGSSNYKKRNTTVAAEDPLSTANTASGSGWN